MTQQWIRGKKNTQPLHIRADPLISEVRKDIAQISKGSEDKLTRFANQFEKMLSRSNYEIEAYYYGDIFTKVVFPLVEPTNIICFKQGWTSYNRSCREFRKVYNNSIRRIIQVFCWKTKIN
ncbi:MAG: hypothetical protein ACRD8W_00665 [Nitrososphaeraceae archaeon]